MDHIGPKGGMLVYVDALPAIEKEPLIAILSLATMLTTHLLTVMDDDEIFVREDPFAPTQLLRIAQFLHEYLFQALWQGSAESAADRVLGEDKARSRQRRDLQSATTRLLRHIRDVDSRHPFIPDQHWVIKGVSASMLLKKLKAERQPGFPGYQAAHAVVADLPHILGFHDRVKLFQEEVGEDRARLLARLGEVRRRPHVTIRRTAVLSDGFREVMQVPVELLKDAVRITFVSELGTEEVGIDQEGLFKVSESS
jgi:ubiquitin-protein ligase E3 B